MENKMTELEQIKHRLAMVKDDLDIIRKFIHDEQIGKHLSETSDECWHNLNNIEVALRLLATSVAKRV